MPQKNIVDLLRSVRHRAGLTQAQLSERLLTAGVSASRGRIANYEAESRRPPLEIIEQWAVACGHRLVLELVPVEQDELGELSPEEEAHLRVLRSLPVEQRRIVERLAIALPGHDIARQGLIMQLTLLEQFGRSNAVGIGDPADKSEVA